MLGLYALAIFLAAALLFVVQPIAGKILLPLMGGSPGVWNTCMVFFQAALLLGYLYAHLATKYLATRVQVGIHAVLLVGALVVLPIPIDLGTPSPGVAPEWWLLKTLVVAFGLPYVLVSTSSPLLQHWFSKLGHAGSGDPYFLAVASNAGSLVGLLAYPLVIEPTLTRHQQSAWWHYGYIALALAIGACGVAVALRRRTKAPSDPAGTTPRPARRDPSPAIDAARAAPITLGRRLRWLALAAVPSSLMLGVTQHISTDLAAIPLLWIIPLTLYLLTFIIAFATRWRIPARFLSRALPFLVIVLAYSMLTFARSPIELLVPLHLATFFVAALLCHTLFADDRPDPAHLTEFYLIMSVGGVLGGAFNALLSPVAFTTVLEYPIAIALACVMRPEVARDLKGLASGSRAMAIALAVLAGAVLSTLVVVVDDLVEMGAVRGEWVKLLRAGLPCVLAFALLFKRGSLRFALGAGAILLCSLNIGRGGELLERRRTFFGTHMVIARPKQPGAEHLRHEWVQLVHGTTLHGVQVNPLPPEGLAAPPILTSADERTRHIYGDDFFTADPSKPPRELTEAELIARRPLLRYMPISYYHPTGPIGDVMKILTREGRLRSAALVGLGTGSLASYARPGSTFIYYEIDPAVVEIAQDPRLFTYVQDALAIPAGESGPPPRIGFMIGDGRLRLADKPRPDQAASREPAEFDLIVLDAFSSDAIPIHLLTREAFDVYLSRLKPDGIIAVHISNRHFNLAPVLAAAAEDRKLVSYKRDDLTIRPEDDVEFKRTSHWVVLSRESTHLSWIARSVHWTREHAPKDFRVWTDDYSNVLKVMR